jgi:Retrotransposon gag protein
MEIPYYCTIQALSLIKGPMVNDWAADQVQILRDRVNHPINPIGHDQEVHWIEFERAFDATFTDTTKQQNAHNTLRQLRMQGNDLDNYVTTFKKLARDTRYALDAQGTIFVFTTGLKPGLRKAILHREHHPNTMNEWIKAARSELQKFFQRLAFKDPKAMEYAWVQKKPFQYTNG